MVNVINMENINSRTFGWVQDPSNFESLYKVVSIFNFESVVYKNLYNNIIPKIVEERDGKQRLIEALEVRPLMIKYSDLVGTSFKPRNIARCNGIVQAAIEGQRRPYIADWPADNFVRWAHALGFIKYNYYDDTFEITELGIELSNAEDEKERNEIIKLALLSYPPVSRILSLLETGRVMTKFELGRNLGFIGEYGFTSLPQDILIMSLGELEDAREKNRLKTDVEGSADKYARMIATWLEKVGLVRKTGKTINVNIGNKEYAENLGQAYIITTEGIKALNMIRGKSRHKKISKTVCWEMFATKGIDRDYVRTRRAYILKALIEASKGLSLNEIEEKLQFAGIPEYYTTIKDDICGFVNVGIDIELYGNKYYLNDEINDFIIPRLKQINKSDVLDKKEQLRENLDTLSHEYLSLLDLAYDGSQNRLFEMKVMDLLINECKYSGLHLGGGRKPDGIIYAQKYGVIIDTKAYSKGYNLPISQSDEMIRYITENNSRDEESNQNKWWENFGEGLEHYYFAFISGEFIGNIAQKLNRIALVTKVNGVALAIYSLLRLANEIKANRITLENVEEIFINNVY